MHGDVGIVNDGDVDLALSYSGESEELLNLLPALRRFSVKIISLTGNVKSSLARHTDVSLNVKIPKEACPFNLAPTSSTTAALVMGDALAMAGLAAYRDSTQKKISAKYHPERRHRPGNVIKIGDIMRSGEAQCRGAGKICPVKEALLVMTHAKFGSLRCVGSTWQGQGYLTDGDFRAVSWQKMKKPSVPATEIRDDALQA